MRLRLSSGKLKPVLFGVRFAAFLAKSQSRMPTQLQVSEFVGNRVAKSTALMVCEIGGVANPRNIEGDMRSIESWFTNQTEQDCVKVVGNVHVCHVSIRVAQGMDVESDIQTMVYDHLLSCELNTPHIWPL